jgi:hypothetical protein
MFTVNTLNNVSLCWQETRKKITLKNKKMSHILQNVKITITQISPTQQGHNDQVL